MVILKEYHTSILEYGINKITAIYMTINRKFQI